MTSNDDDYTQNLLNQILEEQFKIDYPDAYNNYVRSGDRLDGFDYPSFLDTYGSQRDKDKYRNETLSGIVPYDLGDFLGAAGVPDSSARQELLSRINNYKLTTPEERRGRNLYRKLTRMLGDANVNDSIPLDNMRSWMLQNPYVLENDINKNKERFLEAYQYGSSYDDILKRYGLNYNTKDVAEAQALQIRALRDAVNDELQRRKGL